MHEPRSGQIEFGFDGAGQEEGYGVWVRERNEAMAAAARQLAHPNAARDIAALAARVAGV